MQLEPKSKQMSLKKKTINKQIKLNKTIQDINDQIEKGFKSIKSKQKYKIWKINRKQIWPIWGRKIDKVDAADTKLNDALNTTQLHASWIKQLLGDSDKPRSELQE